MEIKQHCDFAISHTEWVGGLITESLAVDLTEKRQSRPGDPYIKMGNRLH